MYTYVVHCFIVSHKNYYRFCFIWQSLKLIKKEKHASLWINVKTVFYDGIHCKHLIPWISLHYLTQQFLSNSMIIKRLPVPKRMYCKGKITMYIMISKNNFEIYNVLLYYRNSYLKFVFRNWNIFDNSCLLPELLLQRHSLLVLLLHV